MGRIFGIVMLALTVYVAAEIYTKGMDHAFGGILSSFNDPVVDLPEGPGKPITQRVGEHVQGKLDSAYSDRLGVTSEAGMRMGDEADDIE